jgi:hypothetical protein
VHAQYITEHKGKIVWLSDIKKVTLGLLSAAAFCSSFSCPPYVIKSGKTAGEQFSSILDELSQRCEAIFVSFDIDSIRSSDCPVR